MEPMDHYEILQDLYNYLRNVENILHQSDGNAENYFSNHESDILKGASYSERDARNIEELLATIGSSFHDMLFQKIKEKHMKETDVYKKANMDRRFFAKIKSNPDYHPRKKIVLALAVALELNLDETSELLAAAEYSFSSGSRRDLIVKYFIEKEVFDINVINHALEAFGEDLIG